MCVICISAKGVKQPTKELMQQMWKKNPHGAGYMFARSKYVYIRKGFMSFNEFYAAVKAENFTAEDIVVYHFRILTQAGVNPEMTHPFMLTDKLSDTRILRARVNVGICHNGIISLTSGKSDKYSDTALYITKYLSDLVLKPADLKNPVLQGLIEDQIHSKMAILDYAGNVTKIGRFTKDDSGLEFSNTFFKPVSYSYSWYGVA